MNRAAKIARAARGQVTKVGDKAFDGGIKASSKVSKAFVKKVDKTPFNAYTGLKTTGWATVGAFGAAGIWGTATYEGTKDKKMMENVQTDYIGQAPVQNYDGVSNAPSLGASGSMVFGLHNSRRG